MARYCLDVIQQPPRAEARTHLAIQAFDPQVRPFRKPLPFHVFLETGVTRLLTSSCSFATVNPLLISEHLPSRDRGTGLAVAR